jgi:hypothetical protein
MLLNPWMFRHIGRVPFLYFGCRNQQKAKVKAGKLLSRKKAKGYLAQTTGFDRGVVQDLDLPGIPDLLSLRAGGQVGTSSTGPSG